MHLTLKNKTILITGGSGSFGRAFCQQLIQHEAPAQIVIYSRDEYKQLQLKQTLLAQQTNVDYVIGDVRDLRRLTQVMRGVDVVVHAAALKHVPVSEQHPMEFIQTNVMGAHHVIQAAVQAGVERVIALSTDKAVEPLNLYGATKLCADKLFVCANRERGNAGTRFSVVRYGNVMGSRGSVMRLFMEQKKTGVLTLTHPYMTRFFLSLEEGARFVAQSLSHMQGGEIFVPKASSATVKDMAQAIAPESEHRVVGIREGEKMHEVLIPTAEAPYCLEYPDHFRVNLERCEQAPLGARNCSPSFSYTSENNPERFSVESLRAFIHKASLQSPVAAL